MSDVNNIQLQLQYLLVSSCRASEYLVTPADTGTNLVVLLLGMAEGVEVRLAEKGKSSSPEKDKEETDQGRH